jgi:GT2 family glycosyltransferase
MTEEVSISFIIVNRNGAQYLLNCIKSILKHIPPFKIELIVVDNNSTDDSIILLKTIFSQYIKNGIIKVIENNINLGSARARNLGATVASYKWLIFLDEDTELREDFFRKVAELLKQEEAIYGPISVFLDNKEYIDSSGFYFTKYGFLYHDFAHKKVIELLQYYSGLREVFALKGCCMIIPKNLFKELGGFSEDFFMFVEDTDICWRAHLYNKKVYCASNLIIYHKGGGVTNNQNLKIRSSLRNYWGVKNYIKTLLYNLGNKKLLTIFPVIITLYLAYSLFLFLNRRIIDGLYILKAILDIHLEFKNIISRRKIIQQKIRKVSDDTFLPRLTYNISLLSLIKFHLQQS